jgi:hypothetical protein
MYELNWKRITFTDTDVECGEHNRFIGRIKQCFESANEPKDFALFQHTNFIKEGWWVGFLTPVAAHHCKSLCDEYNSCVPWKKPDRNDEVAWVAGDEDAWRVFTP